MGTLSGIAPDSLAEGLGAIAPENRFKGQEHEVYYDWASGKVVKLTLPGEVGARCGLLGYRPHQRVQALSRP
jgi:hypothetical protein